MSTSQTGIAVTAKILFLNFVMLLFKPVVEIDGVVHEGAWSSVYFSTAPGDHNVSVYWKYMWVLPVNRATAQVTVPEGTTVEVTYRPRWFVFLPGRISVAQAVPVTV